MSICPSIQIFYCLHASIYKYEPISTKIGQNASECKISDDFVNVMRPELSELSAFDLEKLITIIDYVYTLASANMDQSAPNLVTIFITNRS